MIFGFRKRLVIADILERHKIDVDLYETKN